MGDISYRKVKSMSSGMSNIKRTLVVSFITSKDFKSSAAPLNRSLVTSQILYLVTFRANGVNRKTYWSQHYSEGYYAS